MVGRVVSATPTSLEMGVHGCINELVIFQFLGSISSYTLLERIMAWLSLTSFHSFLEILLVVGCGLTIL